MQIDQRFECSYQAPDFMSDVRCFWRGPPLVPTAAEKRVIRDARRKLREAHPDFTLTRETRDELIRESRDEATWLRSARAQLSPDYEEATTEVWRHIRATPRGAPNTTDVRAWADKVNEWGPAWLAAFAVRSNATLLEDKQAIAAAELAFHLFDPSLNCKSRRTSRNHCRGARSTLRGRRPPRRHSPER